MVRSEACEDGGRRRQAERQRRSRGLEGIKNPPLTSTLTDTHSVRGQRVWPGPGSFLAPSVSLCPRRSRSTNPPRWFLAHLPSTSPEQRRREQQHRGKEGPLPAPAPHLPSPRKQLQELRPCSAAWEKGPRVAEQRGSQGLVVRKERGTVCPRGSGLGGRSQVRRPGASPRAGIPQASLCSRSQDTEGGGFSPKPGPLAARLL